MLSTTTSYGPGSEFKAVETASSRLAQLADQIANPSQGSGTSKGAKMQTNGNHSKPQVLLCGNIVWSWSEIDELRSKFDFLVRRLFRKAKGSR